MLLVGKQCQRAIRCHQVLPQRFRRFIVDVSRGTRACDEDAWDQPMQDLTDERHIRGSHVAIPIDVDERWQRFEQLQ